MTLYETLIGCVRTLEGISENILSTIKVKQRCPLSPTLFGLFIDELESFIFDATDVEVGGLLHDSRGPLLLFADDIILISHIVTGLQSLVAALDTFSSQQGLEVNLKKTKVMVFNISKATLNSTQILFCGSLIETSSYTY